METSTGESAPGDEHALALPTEPAPEMSATERRLWGIFACALALLPSSLAVAFTLTLASMNLTGCFIICAEPSPAVGLAWSAVSALVLAAPFAFGMAIAGVRSRTAWLAVAVVSLAAVAWALYP